MTGREIVVRPDQTEAIDVGDGVTKRVFIGEHGEGHWVHAGEFPPGSIIEPHAHDCAQFMVILKGGGTLASDPLTPGTVHYTDANVPYGPIVAGPDGLTFMVIRPDMDHQAATYYTSETIKRVRAAQSR